MKVVILCGGQGTRLREETEYRPKPLVEVGGRPILWHIMKLFAHYGQREFILCLTEQPAADPTLHGEAFNFSNEIQLTVLELVQNILQMMASPLVPEVRNEASHEIRQQYLCSAKARARLGWSPLYDLPTGLAHTVEWYQEYFRHDG